MATKILSGTLLFLTMAGGATAETPATLIPGLGDHHHAIQTDSVDAQRFFDQGLILTFAFNHEEAIRSFEKAHELDLLKNRRNGRSLFGLWQSLAAQGKPTDAEFVRTQFEKAWRNADIELKVGGM